MSDGYTIDHDFPAYQEPVFTPPTPVLASSAADLRRKVFPPIRFVVPIYFVEGCTLFAGRPKLGKSWLMLEVGLAVARGGDCLGGIKCEQGDVLYLALEDNERRLQRRIDKMLGPFAQEWPLAFEYETEWRRANDGGLDDIRTWIKSKPNPRLVVVDVLAMFKPVRGSKESLYEADYNAIKGLQQIAGEFGIAIVVVHHTRKSGTESDPFEKVSGTLGLSGAADTTLILDRDGNGATLYGRGRDIEEIESAVVFDKVGCRWFVQGEASEVRRTDERGSILAALADATEPMSPTDIADATRMPNQNVRQLLVAMVKVGDVTKLGRGRYGHPDHNHTPHHNDHKITKLAEYRAAKGGDALTKPVSEPKVCDRTPAACDRPPPLDHKPEAPARSADTPLCDDVIDVTGGSGTPGSQPEPTGTEDDTLATEELVPTAEGDPDVTDHNGDHNKMMDGPPTIAAHSDPARDDTAETADTSRPRGTIVAAEPWRRSKRTNRNIVTIFTISSLSRGVKASAGPLVQLTDAVNPRIPDSRKITADKLGRERNAFTSYGGKWPCWIAVVEGDHSRTGFPTEPDAFDTWFATWAAKRSGKVLGDWRDEARADGALDWLKREDAR